MVYTIRSLFEGSTRCVFLYEDQVSKYRLHSFNSVHTAEISAKYWALPFIWKQTRQGYLLCRLPKGFAGFSMAHVGPTCHFGDSVASVPLSRGKKTLLFLWVSGHTSLLGNEVDGAVAKEAAAPLKNLTWDKEMFEPIFTTLFCLRAKTDWHREWKANYGWSWVANLTVQ
jgi:hypothetical protein